MKSAAIAALDHIVTEVINPTTTSNGGILTILKENGYNDILDLVNIRSTDIDGLTHTMPGGTILFINKGECGLIRSFLSFVKYNNIIGTSFNKEDAWEKVTADEFNKYCGGRNYADIDTGIVWIAPPPIGDHCNAITDEEFGTYRTSPESRDLNYNLGVGTVVVAPIASNSTTASDEIRAMNGNPVDRHRDEQALPTLNDEKQSDTSWHCSNTVQTRSQAVENVLDPSFTAGSDKEEKKSMASNYESQFLNAKVCRTQRQPERAACNLDIITSKLERCDIDSTIEVLQDGIWSSFSSLTMLTDNVRACLFRTHLFFHIIWCHQNSTEGTTENFTGDLIIHE